MKTARPRIARVIADKALQSGVTQELARETAAYLLSEGRVHELDSVLRDVQAAWTEAGLVEVIASSAHPLSADVRRDIFVTITRLYPEAKQIMITESHDPKVIGGVRLNLANQQLDLSVEAKLNKFKQLTTTGKD